MLQQNEGGNLDKVSCKFEETRTPTPGKAMGLTKMTVKKHPKWAAVSQAEKPPVQTEDDQRPQERFVKKRLRRLF